MDSIHFHLKILHTILTTKDSGLLEMFANVLKNKQKYNI